MGIVFCGFERENSFAVSPKVLSVDVPLVSKGFPAANVLRQFSGEEITKIDDLKTSEHILERFHFSGEKKKANPTTTKSHDSSWKERSLQSQKALRKQIWYFLLVWSCYRITSSLWSTNLGPHFRGDFHNPFLQILIFFSFWVHGDLPRKISTNVWIFIIFNIISLPFPFLKKMSFNRSEFIMARTISTMLINPPKWNLWKIMRKFSLLFYLDFQCNTSGR